MTRTLLIDSDIVAYKAASAKEEVYLFDGEGSEPAVEGNLEEALAFALGTIGDYAATLRATRVIVCLTDEVNFRTAVCSSYKGNRKAVRKPSTLASIKQHFAQHFECYQRPGLEADDCMGILSTHKTLIPGEKVIVSEDKDMETIPGLLFNPRKDKAPRRITEVEADRFFFSQVLTGDTTDGYTGCPGIGPKSPFVTTLSTDKDARAMWQTVLAGYASKGLTADHAVLQARMARILRACDWDFAAKAPRLWNPPVN